MNNNRFESGGVEDQITQSLQDKKQEENIFARDTDPKVREEEINKRLKKAQLLDRNSQGSSRPGTRMEKGRVVSSEEPGIIKVPEEMQKYIDMIKNRKKEE